MKVASLYTEKTGPGTFRVETSLEQRGFMKELFEGTGVVIPIEEKIITGTFTGDRIKERNFLFAGINLDLNHDGDLDDTFTVSEKKGSLYIDALKIEQLLYPKLYKRLQGLSYYNSRKEPKIYKIGKEGTPFVVYSMDPKRKSITMGTGKKEQPVTFREFPNPCLQIIVFKTALNLSHKPSYRITGHTNYFLLSNEKIFENQGDEWVSAVWAVKKIDINRTEQEKYIFTISGIDPPFAVVVYGNLSLEKGFRIRTLPAVRMVKQGKHR